MALVAELNTIILDLLNSGSHLHTPSNIIQTIRKHQPHVSSAQIRSSIKRLIEDGDITYSHRFLISHLEPAFKQALRISPRLTLCHEDSISQSARPPDAMVLSSGTAFGVGDHPTTRLSLEAVNFCVEKLSSEKAISETKVLDIGTGSGVLAIAAVFLGVGSAVAIDTDPSALGEATKNIALNQFEDRIHLFEGDLEGLPSESFDLIMANLRPPTLRRLFPIMLSLTGKSGLWMLSGFRPESIQGLLAYPIAGEKRQLWSRSQHNWSAIVIHLEM